ncbi:transketolase [Acetobacteraceae bacterium KSS8]|uniref:Transketolase n=1 Tax=Endosaccharibacter trunci TaxID=2812733 RepID=A0ABT1W6H6_9PROT|nr:transketolase [Acetobacteraceae bacterium KSS8]
MQQRPQPIRSPAPALVPAIAVAAATLWQRFLRFDPADPGWADRDRFILSSGRFSALLDWLLAQAGTEPEGDAPFGRHPAREMEAGPPGQGFACAVGQAMGERVLAARFGRTLVDHRTWVLACETDLAAGVSLEAAELAGRMELEKLAVLYEPATDGRQEGRQDGPDAATRFAAAGWAVRQVDASDPDAVAAAIARTQRNRRPTLIACLPGAAPLPLPDPLADTPSWLASGQRGAAARRGWLKRLARHRMAGEFERQLRNRLPPHWPGAMTAGIVDSVPSDAMEAARGDLSALFGALPEAVSLQSASGIAASRANDGPAEPRADAMPAGSGLVMPVASRSPGAPLPGSRHLFCGVQEHGMAAISNGLSLHGGLRPLVSASVLSIDRMRPALRLAALMEQPVVYLLADRAPDGSGWAPVEQFASLRAMPHVFLFRPADPVELAACWRLALAREDGPSLLAVSERARFTGGQANASEPSWRHEGCAQGGYVLAEAATRRDATLIATGPEVAAALAARTRLARLGVDTAVVSLPCWELFADKPAAYHAHVLGSAPRIGIEAASGFGWERWLGPGGVFIGMDGFGPRHRGGRDHAGEHRGVHAAAGPGSFGPRRGDRPDEPAEAGVSSGITSDCISTRVLGLLGMRDADNLNRE